MGMLSYIREEIRVVKERDPAIKSSMEVLLYPSFKVILRYRVAHKLYLKKHYFLARWISQRAARKTGIEIHPGAQIGKGLFIDHGSGVIIGETTVIGDNVTLYQGVTLGGTGKEQGKRHPTLEDNVMVSAGAKILGSFTIGENSKIGAGSVVLEEVPPNCTVVGVPGRIVKRDDKKVLRSEMDQINLPDPVLSDIRELQKESRELHNQLTEMVQKMRCMKQCKTEQTGAIMMILPVLLVITSEHIGHQVVTSKIVGRDLLSDPGLHRSLFGDNFSTMVSGLIGSVPTTTYGENIGVMAVTKVYSVRVIGGAAVLSIICSFVGKLSMMIQTIPGPVIGGISFLLYGMIGASGLRILVDSQVDYGRSRNLMLTSIVFVTGLSGISVNIGTVSLTGMVLACVVAMILSLVFYILDKLKLTNDQ